MTRQEILAIAKPILFNTEMVRAIQDNRKTATRRVVKFPTDLSATKVDSVCLSSVRDIPCWNFTLDDSIYHGFIKPLANIGDYLYVRETWNSISLHDVNDKFYIFKSTYDYNNKKEIKWHPSIHMPKEAARLFLRVTDVRVERLQDITEQQAIAEGIEEHPIPESGYKCNGGKKLYERADGGGTTYYPTEAFAELWDSTIKKSDLPRYGWNANPWVWVIEFERVNIDG